jgi:hypothetical protein
MSLSERLTNELENSRKLECPVQVSLGCVARFGRRWRYLSLYRKTSIADRAVSKGGKLISKRCMRRGSEAEMSSGIRILESKAPSNLLAILPLADLTNLGGETQTGRDSQRGLEAEGRMMWLSHRGTSCTFPHLHVSITSSNCFRNRGLLVHGPVPCSRVQAPTTL